MKRSATYTGAEMLVNYGGLASYEVPLHKPYHSYFSFRFCHKERNETIEIATGDLFECDNGASYVFLELPPLPQNHPSARFRIESLRLLMDDEGRYYIPAPPTLFISPRVISHITGKPSEPITELVAAWMRFNNRAELQLCLGKRHMEGLRNFEQQAHHSDFMLSMARILSERFQVQTEAILRHWDVLNLERRQRVDHSRAKKTHRPTLLETNQAVFQKDGRLFDSIDALNTYLDKELKKERDKNAVLMKLLAQRNTVDLVSHGAIFINGV